MLPYLILSYLIQAKEGDAQDSLHGQTLSYLILSYLILSYPGQGGGCAQDSLHGQTHEKQKSV